MMLSHARKPFQYLEVKDACWISLDLLDLSVTWPQLCGGYQHSPQFVNTAALERSHRQHRGSTSFWFLVLVKQEPGFQVSMVLLVYGLSSAYKLAKLLQLSPV